MSMMLNFSTSAVRHLLREFRSTRLRTLYRQLELAVQWDGIPVEQRVEIFTALAERDSDAGCYGKARKHWKAALALCPNSAELHYQLGVAYQDDPYGCDRRAALRFREASRLAPANGQYMAAYGTALVRLNKVKKAMPVLAAALELAAGDARILEQICTGLFEADQPEVALNWLDRVGFTIADKGLQRLKARAKQQILIGQQKASRQPKHPFHHLKLIRLPNQAGSNVGQSQGILRADRGAVSPTPHSVRIASFQAGQG